MSPTNITASNRFNLLSMCLYHSDEFLRQLPEIYFLEHYKITVNYHHMNSADVKAKN